MPGSATVMRRRCATFALVMPVELRSTSLRCGSSPNSGQSSSRCARRPRRGRGSRRRRPSAWRRRPGRCCRRRPASAQASRRRAPRRVRSSERACADVLAHAATRRAGGAGRYAEPQGPLQRAASRAGGMRAWPRPRRSASRRRTSSSPGTDGPVPALRPPRRARRAAVLPGRQHDWCARNSSAPTATAPRTSRRWTRRSWASPPRTSASHEGFAAKHCSTCRCWPTSDKQVAQGLQRLLAAPGHQARGDRDRRAGHRAPPPRPPARARLPVGRRAEGRARRAPAAAEPAQPGARARRQAS